MRISQKDFFNPSHSIKGATKTAVLCSILGNRTFNSLVPSQKLTRSHQLFPTLAWPRVRVGGARCRDYKALLIRVGKEVKSVGREKMLLILP